ncbi:g3357 [Coccomyxa elongata]
MCITDEDPVTQAFIPRRCTLTQKQWDTYLGSEEARPSASVAFDSFSSATGTAPVLRKEGLRRNFASKWQRSLFGLPIISPFSAFARTWSGVILGLDLVYTAFLIPILVAFEVPDVGWTWGCFINLIAGTLYFAELLINFHVGFIGKYGAQKKIVLDGKAVAWYYITQGQFLVDTLTAIAWIAQITLIILWDNGINVHGTAATVYQIIRIFRMVRFASLMRRLYATATAAGGTILPAFSVKPHYAYFVNLIYGGLAMLSFFSCLMNFVARREHCNSTWINRFGVFLHTYGSADSNTAGVLSADECSAIPDPAKWLGGAYFMLVTMLSIGYGDITPQSITEIIIVMFCMIAGIIFFGILLGSIAEALTDLNKESKRIAKFRSRMENVDKWMGKRGLPTRLRMRIGQHYQEEWIADTEAVEEVQVMDEVPHALRREISYAVNRKVFEKLHVFHDFPVSEQKSIAAMMTPLQLPAGADMCEAGDIADCLWVLHEGSVSAVGATGYETKISTAPALLGETALLQELDGQYRFRPCALRTMQMCLLWVLPTRDLLPLLRQKPTLYHRAVQQAVPSMAFDYLAINPIGENVGGGISGSEFKQNASDGAANSTPGSPQTGAASEGQTPKRPLQTTKSLGSLEGKPSWTTLQQTNLRSQHSRSTNQSQGFNGLINNT